MEKFRINKIEIDLNLPNQYRFFQVNDSHMIYRKNKKEERWFQGKVHFASEFKETYDPYYNNASSFGILKEIIDYINQQKHDGVILNGDIIDYNCKTNYDFLKRLLNKINGNKLFICGNHEKGSTFYNSISLDNNQAFQVIEYPDLLVIGIDNSTKSFTEYQIKRMEEELKKNKKMIVFFHIPIKNQENQKELAKISEYYFVDYDNCDIISKRFIDLLINNKNIVGVFTGHLHGTSKSYLSNRLCEYVTSSALIGYFSEIIIK